MTPVSAQPLDPSLLHADPSPLNADPSVLHRDPSVVNADPSPLHRDPAVLHRTPPSSPRPVTGSTEAENRVSWEVALDRLELDTLLAERLLRALDPPQLQDWTAPDVHGPIPPALEDRARTIALRQAEVQQALMVALGTTMRHQAFTDAVDQLRPPDPPVYLDVTA